MENAFLIGERIALRPLELADAARLARLVTRPEVRPFLNGRRPLSVHAEEAWLRAQAESTDVVLGVVLREGGQLIGTVGLHALSGDPRGRELGIAIGEPSCWGKGYGTETLRLVLDYAFRELEVHRVQLRVFETNPRARAAYLKVGF
ncbi:MAG: N-acetyltransferase, partial [Planctomycetota bacterium]